jgi:ubiquinone/menaquinone biosynthesis C-methylase UbiE
MTIKNDYIEWQAVSSLEDIPPAYLARYRIATKFIGPEDKVLDAACGIGYGAFLIARDAKPRRITAVDHSLKAINHGKQYFAEKRISYLAKDVFELDSLPKGSFDVILSLETLTYLEKDSEFLEILRTLLHPNGLLIISSPNQDVLPFDKKQFPGRYRHYSTNAFIRLLEQNGFAIHTGYTMVVDQVYDGLGGKSNIAICKKTSLTLEPFEPKELVKPYIDLLIKEIKPEASFFREFGGPEARHLMQLGRETEAFYLMDRWVQYDKFNPEAWYVMGYFCEKNNNTLAAKEAFKKATELPASGKNREFVASALFHLANLSTDGKEKIQLLSRCLTLEPGHQRALEMLVRLEAEMGKMEMPPK